MDRKQLKFLVLGAGVLLSMSFLVLVGINRPDGLEYYVTLGEFVATPCVDDNCRVNAKVLAGSIERQPTGQDVRFVITDGTHTLPVSYHGVIPDTFVDGADVVVKGQLEQGTFVANTLLAKCPSKYESADGAEAAPYGASSPAAADPGASGG